MADIQLNPDKKKKVTRRDFLKIAGGGVGGAAATYALMRLFGGGRQVRVWETASGAIIHYPNLCTGCRRCETNCTITNDGKAHAYISRVKINRNLNYGPSGPSSNYFYETGQMGNFEIIGDTCKQCKDPYCGNVCPVGAISEDERTGARVVDEEKCIACGACTRACPFSMIVQDTETGKSKKCTLCWGSPACVAGCPNSALQFVTWEEAVKVYRERGQGAAVQTQRV